MAGRGLGIIQAVERARCRRTEALRGSTNECFVLSLSLSPLFFPIYLCVLSVLWILCVCGGASRFSLLCSLSLRLLLSFAFLRMLLCFLPLVAPFALWAFSAFAR